MRIISGIHKGKRLTAPKSLPVRPTTDFAKEGLFNILVHRFHFSEIIVLDLFSGTGNISYEFASRGVEAVTSVDSHYGCVKYIATTSETLSLPIQAIKSDVTTYISKPKLSVDIVFADPPYNFTVEDLTKLVQQLFANNFLKPEGSIIIEHTKHNDLSHLDNFIEARRYGGSVFSFFGGEL